MTTTTAMAVSPANLFIVGAGFSHHAGLPLASEFTQRLLNVAGLKPDGPSRGQVELIRKFVEASFQHGPATSPDHWPDLEDLFTVIDLSANTGHHLGADFSPAVLRTVRRALIVRTARMLNQRYDVAARTNDAEFQALATFFSHVEPAACAFLSMNWDTVIERGFRDAHNIIRYEYGCEALPATFKSGAIDLRDPPAPTATVLKPHGSFNWLYCDACRQVFWVPAARTESVAAQLFGARDWDTVARITGVRSKAAHALACPTCRATALGTRIATFSYRKALEFPMHARTWQTAETLLRNARNWIFIGYSLPAADYEFKLLLKRVELSRIDKPNIILVTGGPPAGAEHTRGAYEKFFGPNLAAGRPNVFLEGLNPAALAGLADLGCLAKAPVSRPPRSKVSKPLRKAGGASVVRPSATPTVTRATTAPAVKPAAPKSRAAKPVAKAAASALVKKSTVGQPATTRSKTPAKPTIGRTK